MKVLLLNGGGIDSLACAMILKHNEHEVRSLHVDFGYPSTAAESVAAQLIADTYCSSSSVVSISGLPAMGLDESIEPRFRPIQYQQFVLSTIGASYAQMHDITYLVSGARAHAIVGPDFVPAFNTILSKVNLRYLKPLQLTHPLANVTSEDALYDIVKDSPILHDTVSCLASPTCGVCLKCKFRAKYGI